MKTPVGLEEDGRTIRARIQRRRSVSFLVLFTFSIAAIPGCGNSHQLGDPITRGTLRGVIYVIGNEPFTSLALQDSLGQMHRIHGPKDLENILYQRQGKAVAVTVVGTNQGAEGPVVEIGALLAPPILLPSPADSTNR